MKSPLFHTAAYNVICDRSITLTLFLTTCKKMPRYWGELARQLVDRFTALYSFHDVFVHGVVKLSFSNKFFSD